MMMKKFLRLLSTAAAGIMAFTMIPKLPETEVNAADPDRYTVLVLDTSGSMRGTPMIKEREAAEKFCTDILNAGGNNYVALVTLNTRSNVVTPFTTDIDTISSDIAALNASGGTNYSDALNTAGSLLADVDASNIRNIVFCSDGLPEDGSRSTTGRYTSSDDSYCYSYANAAYDIATGLKENYNIYTLGFFHSLSGKKLDFGTRLMADLASSASQAYNVTDPDQLLFEFGNVAQTVLTNDNYPIVLIPGIMGSRLYSDSDCTDMVWEPTLTSTGLKDKINKDKTLYVHNYDSNGEPIDQNAITDKGDREVGANKTMKDLINELCENMGNRGVYVFNYDWRKSNNISAESLNEFINAVSAKTNCPKVDIVAHSMGGLVTSKYLTIYGDSKTEKIITCGTPYEGAPHLLEAIDTSVVLNDWFLDQGLVLKGLDSDTKRSFDGVAELTPTERYCQTYPMQRNNPDLLSPTPSFDMSYQEYTDTLNNIFGTTATTKAIEFQNSLRTANGYNALLDYDNAYFVVGQEKKTVKEAVFANDVDGDPFCYDVIYTNNGDNQVPYTSATMMGQIDASASNVYPVSDTHIGMLKNSGVISWIVGVLSSNVPQVQPVAPSLTPYTVIRIACPVDVEISDGNGSLSSVKGSESFSASFGRLDLIGVDNDIKMICMDEDTNLDVNLTGTGTGTMNYTIRHYTANDELIDERTFENVPITDKTVIKTKANNEDTTVLSVDNDGDGNEDATWTAKKNEDVTVPDSERVAMTGINASIDAAELSVDDTAKITVTKDPENTTDNMTVTFSSSDENVATVDANGAVKAVGAGNATITVTSSNGFTKEINVSVKAASTTSTTTTTTSTVTSTTTAAKTTANSSNSPKTGDTTPITAYVITAFAFGIGAVLARRSRKED